MFQSDLDNLCAFQHADTRTVPQTSWGQILQILSWTPFPFFPSLSLVVQLCPQRLFRLVSSRHLSVFTFIRQRQFPHMVVAKLILTFFIRSANFVSEFCQLLLNFWNTLNSFPPFYIKDGICCTRVRSISLSVSVNWRRPNSSNKCRIASMVLCESLFEIGIFSIPAFARILLIIIVQLQYNCHRLIAEMLGPLRID